jgi:hypothetical protein
MSTFASHKPLVAWWDKNVSVFLVSEDAGPKSLVSADRRSSISLSEAEKLTGIIHQWSKRGYSSNKKPSRREA